MTCRLAALLVSAALGGADIAAAAPADGRTGLSPVDYAFVGSTYLGNRYQVDSGKLGETHAAAPSVKAYARLMDTSHVQVEDKLVTLLKRKGLTAPSLPLLQGAYASLVRSLSTEQGRAFDVAYVRGQVDYQDANDALYRWEIANGRDADLVAFAKAVLPKIDDHKTQAEALDAAGK
jgi:putative membrane protein